MYNNKNNNPFNICIIEMISVIQEGEMMTKTQSGGREMEMRGEE